MQSSNDYDALLPPARIRELVEKTVRGNDPEPLVLLLLYLREEVSDIRIRNTIDLAIEYAMKQPSTLARSAAAR